MTSQPLGGLDALARDARGDVPRAQPPAQVVASYPLSPWSLAGFRRRGPRCERMGGMPRTSGSRPWLSWVFAAEIPTETGRPDRSVIKWIFNPFLPRSTGFGPVRSPFVARMFTESIAQRDQSTPPAYAELIQEQAVKLAPHPGPGPLGKPPV
jgi:hypothetical protein